jgi:hypothetical protein
VASTVNVQQYCQMSFSDRRNAAPSNVRGAYRAIHNGLVIIGLLAAIGCQTATQPLALDKTSPYDTTNPYQCCLDCRASSRNPSLESTSFGYCAAIQDDSSRFVETAMTSQSGTRAWCNGTIVIYVRDGKIVLIAYRLGDAVPEIPKAGTKLYLSDGKTVAGVIPESARHFSDEAPVNDSGDFQSIDDSNPDVAENGSYYGEISDRTGLPRTTYVQGYYRQNGTYVRSYYRSH